MRFSTTNDAKVGMNAARRSVVACVLLLVALAQVTWCEQVTELVSGLPVLNGGENNSANTIWSYALAQMLQKDLTKDGNPYYQDLQMVFPNCHSGGFVDAIKTLKVLPGNYSAVSAVPAAKDTVYDPSLEAKGQWNTKTAWPNDGLPGHYLVDTPPPPVKYKNSVLRLKPDDKTYIFSDTPSTNAKDMTWYSMSYGSQYILGLEGDPTRTAKQLADYAATYSAGLIPPGNAVYGGTGMTSTINGDANTESKHAILYYGGNVDPFMQNEIEVLSTFLDRQQNYNSVTTLFAGGPNSAFPLPGPVPGFNRTNWQQATRDNLDAALQSLATSLQAHPGAEKAFLYFGGHGGMSDQVQTWRTKDPDPPEPGEGYIYDSSHNHVTLALPPDFQREVQEEIKKPGGGYLVDDPSLHRDDPPWLNLTTYSQHVTGAVQVFLGGALAGTIPMNGVRGEYSLALSDAVLDQLAWSSTSDLNLDISFGFASPEDWFQISTAYDYYQDPVFSADFNSYGIGIENTLNQGPYASPEPSTLVLLSSGFLGLTGFLRKRLFT